MIWAYDIEVFPNLFTVSFKNVDTSEERSFVIGEFQNDLRSLLVFLSAEVKTLVGFNNIGYDYPVIEPILSNWKHFWERYQDEPLDLAKFFYERSKDIIENDRDHFFQNYWYFDHVIEQIDLYKIYHLDNKNKRGTSLKWIEFSINHELLQTFDYDPHVLVTESQVKEILEYNLNDVRATKKFYDFSVDKIEYRRTLGNLEGLNLINQSDTSISKKLFAKYLTRSMGIGYKELKSLKTHRSQVAFKDIIFDYVQFKTEKFQRFLDYLKSYIYKPGSENNEFKPTVEHCDLHFDYGVGGLHAYPKKWVTGKHGKTLKDPVSIPQDDKSDDIYQIIHIDVKSYYPNIAISNKIKPAHLGEDFDKIYKYLYDKRRKAQEDGDQLMNLAMKLTLNSAFGLAKEEHSFFYDPKFLWTITINGQLLLTMLAEELYLNNIKMLQCNTDGIYVKVEKSRIDLLNQICDAWCKTTNLVLEHDYYDILVQKDVNNYIGLKDNGKVTKKGSFRDIKQVHEDSSMSIVPKALEQYLIYGKDYREYIKNYSEIEPFLMAIKIKGKQDEVQERYLSADKTRVEYTRHKKAVRYIVSKNGNAFYKYWHESGKDQKIQAGFKCTCANDLNSISRDQINESFYIKEVEKITSLFDRQQLNLF